MYILGIYLEMNSGLVWTFFYNLKIFRFVEYLFGFQFGLDKPHKTKFIWYYQIQLDTDSFLSNQFWFRF